MHIMCPQKNNFTFSITITNNNLLITLNLYKDALEARG